MKKHLYQLIVLALVMVLLISYGIRDAAADEPSYWATDEINRALALKLVPSSLQSMYGDAITREEFAQLTMQTLCIINPALSDSVLSSSPSDHGLSSVPSDAAQSIASTDPALSPEPSDSPQSNTDINAKIFTDTDSDAVIFCFHLGIVDGYGDGTFRPDYSIERQAAAKMLYMAASSLDKASAVRDYLHAFADSKELSTWASTSVQWVYDAGIMRGDSHNQFMPHNTYTREQAILTMLRLYDYSKGNPSQTSEADRVISCNKGDISVYNHTDTLSGGTLYTRGYDIYNGDQVTMGSYVNNGAAAGATLIAQFSTEILDGYIKYYDIVNEEWIVTDLKTGSYSASMIYVMSDSVNYFFYLPRAWKVHENSTLEAITNRNGYMSVHNGAEGFIIELYAYNLPNGYRSDFTCVSSRDGLLIDWTHSNSENLWKNYTLDGDGKWCYDGYYFPAPVSYIPTGTNYFYRLPAAYLLRSFLSAQSVHRVAQDMSLCMMDTIALQQNSEGFFPTMSGSTWLSQDYKIGPRFYDTRFNTDFIELMVKGYSLYGGDRYYETLQRYADFFVKYADNHHRITPSGGWLVDDYYHPSGNRRTHTSLNHQLAEIIVLYKLSDTLDRSDLSELADKMLLAIEDSGKYWVRSDKNLHYSKQADGSYGGNDYPYLTYNDMYNLQALLKARTGKTNDTLTMLMANKKAWMDANGVTGYLK